MSDGFKNPQGEPFPLIAGTSPFVQLTCFESLIQTSRIVVSQYQYSLLDSLYLLKLQYFDCFDQN